LEPAMSTGTMTGMVITLDGSGIDAGNVPVVGSYTTATPSNNDPLTFYALVVQQAGAQQTIYATDTVAVGHNFQITSFASNIVAGNGNCKVFNMSNVTETKDIYFSFENVPFQ